MRVSIKSMRTAKNTIDIYAISADGHKMALCRFVIPADGDFVADTEAAKAIIKAISSRWKDVF